LSIDWSDTGIGEFSRGDTNIGESVTIALPFCSFVHFAFGAFRAGKLRIVSCWTACSGLIAGEASSGFFLAVLLVIGPLTLGDGGCILGLLTFCAFVLGDITTVQPSSPFSD
ncbi:hypothetical protein, partial [Cobetia crustatorum]|uniref:hypothetical protein n=1 Tax=Cobetia crustatorum TaxID=553385 RepID=UPI001C98A1BE